MLKETKIKSLGLVSNGFSNAAGVWKALNGEHFALQMHPFKTPINMQPTKVFILMLAPRFLLNSFPET
jgi:hypothetical protein